MKKWLEIIFFLAVCAVLVYTYFVEIPLYAKLILILLCVYLPGAPTFGRWKKKWEFLRRIPNYFKLDTILFFAVCFGFSFLVDLVPFLPPPVNGTMFLYIMLVEWIHSVFYLLYLFSPQSLHLLDQPAKSPSDYTIEDTNAETK